MLRRKKINETEKVVHRAFVVPQNPIDTREACGSRCDTNGLLRNCETAAEGDGIRELGPTERARSVCNSL